MSAVLLDGRRVAAGILAEVERESRMLRARAGTVPGLAFFLVGDDPASLVYVEAKEKACRAAGFRSHTERLPGTASEAELLRRIAALNADGAIHGILVQLPLPPGLDEGRVLEAVDFRKDVDGLHPVNVGRLVLGRPCLRPCTPAGVQELLLRSGYSPSGKHVVVVGRSNLVGKPLVNILLQKREGANAVVTIAHTGAGDIGRLTRMADILIAAAGSPGCITGEMVKPGCVVVDVGINRLRDPAAGRSRLVGDVEFDSVVEVAGALTPVPGGVGPMTIAMLMRNTLDAAAGTVYPA
ncbi:MAG: bifunctional methylenetetrahydrofolate dehydrogenase/methenyltetrahydrofolate cyclohydrolase FolD [Bacteroidota bacterium]